jgi:hypothetical protein
MSVRSLANLIADVVLLPGLALAARIVARYPQEACSGADESPGHTVLGRLGVRR